MGGGDRGEGGTDKGEDAKLLKKYCVEEHPVCLSGDREQMQVLEAEKKQERGRVKIKTLLSARGPEKRGSSVSPHAPTSKIGHFRKYFYSARASFGVMYCPSSLKGN